MKKVLVIAIFGLSFIKCSETPQYTTESKSLSMEDIELDTAIHVVEELKKEELILGENDFGELTLIKDRELTLDSLTRSFPNYTIRQEVGHQDGPDYVLYEISKDERLIASVKMMDNNKSIIDKIQIEDKGIVDEFGFTTGTSFKKLIKKRPGLESTIIDHSHVYLTEVGSPIGYEIEGAFNRIDPIDFNNDELMDWKVRSLIWFNPDF
ncbi:MAG: DUF1131 family protein [Flavobacteriales bacterium]|nr:DUF1131 family protein [Flavobacteriales bacterium]